jgi:hypothetical protein
MWIHCFLCEIQSDDWETVDNLNISLFMRQIQEITISCCLWDMFRKHAISLITSTRNTVLPSVREVQEIQYLAIYEIRTRSKTESENLDFRLLLLRCWWDLRSSGILRRVIYQKSADLIRVREAREIVDDMNIPYHPVWKIEQSSYCIDTLLEVFMNNRNSLNNRYNNVVNTPEVLHSVNIS